MPIYEYECQACHHYLDVLQKLSDEPLTFCPECGKAKLKKLVSAPSFRLKGGGWYETDFKQDKRRNLADGGGKPDGADKPAAPAGDKPAADTKSTTADSKPAATASGPAASGNAASGKAASGKAGGDTPA